MNIEDFISDLVTQRVSPKDAAELLNRLARELALLQAHQPELYNELFSHVTELVAAQQQLEVASNSEK